jgi:hypothetical protein
MEGEMKQTKSQYSTLKSISGLFKIFGILNVLGGFLLGISVITTDGHAVLGLGVIFAGIGGGLLCIALSEVFALAVNLAEAAAATAASAARTEQMINDIGQMLYDNIDSGAQGTPGSPPPTPGA